MRMLRSFAAGALIAGAFSVLMALPIGGNRADPALTVVSGLASAALVVPIATRVTAAGWRRFELWFFLFFLNLTSVAIEGSLFAPAASPPSQLGLTLVRLAAVSATVAAVAASLVPGAVSAPSRRDGASRRWYDWAWRVLAAATIYLAVYFLVGGLNYTFVTHPYYESHAGSLTVPSLQVVLAYEPIRGILIAFSVVPLVLALRMRGAQLAAVVGATLFIVGGFVVLLPQVSLPLYLRMASLWEVLAQNVITGIACAYLFHLKPAYHSAIEVMAS